MIAARGNFLIAHSLIAFVCGLKGLEAAKRQGKGILLATVALVISCLLFLLAIAFFVIELGAD